MGRWWISICTKATCCRSPGPLTTWSSFTSLMIATTLQVLLEDHHRPSRRVRSGDRWSEQSPLEKHPGRLQDLRACSRPSSPWKCLLPRGYCEGLHVGMQVKLLLGTAFSCHYPHLTTIYWPVCLCHKVVLQGRGSCSSCCCWYCVSFHFTRIWKVQLCHKVVPQGGVPGCSCCCCCYCCCCDSFHNNHGQFNYVTKLFHRVEDLAAVVPEVPLLPPLELLMWFSLPCTSKCSK